MMRGYRGGFQAAAPAHSSQAAFRNLIAQSHPAASRGARAAVAAIGRPPLRAAPPRRGTFARTVPSCPRAGRDRVRRAKSGPSSKGGRCTGARADTPRSLPRYTSGRESRLRRPPSSRDRSRPRTRGAGLRSAHFSHVWPARRSADGVAQSTVPRPHPGPALGDGEDTSRPRCCAPPVDTSHTYAMRYTHVPRTATAPDLRAPGSEPRQSAPKPARSTAS